MEIEFRVGRVCAVGTCDEIEVMPGDIVLWRKFDGHEVPSKDRVVLAHSEVLGVVEDVTVEDGVVTL